MHRWIQLLHILRNGRDQQSDNCMRASDLAAEIPWNAAKNCKEGVSP